MKLAFDNTFVQALPGDPEPRVYPRSVPDACWSPVSPTPVSAPALIAWSPEVAELVGLDPEPDRKAAERLALPCLQEKKSALF